VARLSEFARRVLAAIRARGWLAGGARWVVAASGGPDSTALAAALAELSASGQLALELALAHFDHAIRPDSARDAEWAGRLAERLGAGFFTERGDVPALAARERLTLEEAARNARLAFLERSARSFGAARVAAGHTADDQAETVLFRILRGTGLQGLAGIPAARPISPASPEILLVRPLLELTRREVLAYLADRGLEYLTDPTNRDVAGQARARIRHQLLPELEARYNPGVRGALLRLAEQAGQAQEALKAVARSRLPVASEQSPQELKLPTELLDGPQALRAEIFILAAERVAGRALSARRRLAEAARFLFSAAVGARVGIGEVVAERGYDGVVIRRSGGRGHEAVPAPGTGWSCPATIPGETALPVGRLVAKLVNRQGIDLVRFFGEKTPLVEVFDARLLEPPRRQDARNAVAPDPRTPNPEPRLVCRTRRPGDRFRPFGSAGEKKLKAFLIDRKLPRRERDAVPLVVLGDEILWVVGQRLSETARVPAGAERLVVIEFVPEEPARG